MSTLMYLSDLHGEPVHTVFTVEVVLYQNEALGYARKATDTDNLL